VAAAAALAARGARVIGSDARAVSGEVKAGLQGIEVRDGEEGADLLAGIETVVKSPGVPREAPLIASALAHGIRVIGELELGWRMLGDHEFIALTGSNGKTTTVELIGHIHRVAGQPVVVAGNVGTAIASLPGTLEPEAVIVCEASSFQLEDTEAFAPEAAVLLNLSEDHLDRHGTFAHYREAKLNIFANQPASAIAVVPRELPLDDAGGEAARVTFGAGGDLTFEQGALRWRGTHLIDAQDIRIRGAHNRENAMAAAAVTLARGIEAPAVAEALRTFAGVPHRLEEVARIRDVLYVNDSKATNVASADVGIRSFAGGVHLIAGGRGKGSDYGPLAEPVKRHCKAIYLIGETAAALHEALAPTGLPTHDCGDLERALHQASRAAEPGDTVLLSPACTSYDQYRSYEERGDHFRKLVQALS
jgi:UDP-N-acetylmuramoylalanine--D-glutamate ligase